MTKQILYISFIFFCFSCKTTKSKSAENIKTKDAKTPFTTCLLIEKEFMNKGGKVTEYKELYLRCSVQDYFIKLCECKVSIKELKPYINQSITVEMEVKDGPWDHCSDNLAEVQSRIGAYAVINKIIK